MKPNVLERLNLASVFGLGMVAFEGIVVWFLNFEGVPTSRESGYLGFAFRKSLANFSANVFIELTM
jgi:hypothetical protein